MHGTTVLARTSVSTLLQTPIDALFVGRFDREFVTGVSVTHDAHSAIGGQHALQPFLRIGRAVSDNDHTRMQTVTDADAAAVMEAYSLNGEVMQLVPYL